MTTTLGKPKMVKFEPKICDHCGQSEQYAMRLDRGTAMILRSFYNAVRRLNRNKVHVQNEMAMSMSDIRQGFGGLKGAIDAGFMSNSMEHNLSRPRYHGLVAFVDKGSGEYLLTPKGAKFLRDEPVMRTVIIDKRTKKNAGYFEPHGTVTYSELIKEKVTWSAADATALASIAGDTGAATGQLFPASV